MPTPPTNPMRLVLCFSPKDADGKAELVAHLAPARGVLALWSVDEVLAGGSLAAAFQDAAAGAAAVVLLLSADFFAELEVPPLAEQVTELRRQQALRGLRLIPIVWRGCD